MRDAFTTGVTKCRASVLDPDLDQGLTPDLRAALAQRIWRNSIAGAEELPFDPATCDLGKIAEGRMPSDPWHISIVRFTDLVSLDPEGVDDSDLTALSQAGLREPQIIALCELIGFICFELRVSYGLSLLQDLP